MKKVICVKCGKTLDHDTLFCPDCGAAIFQHAVPDPKPTRKRPELNKLLPPAAVVLAVILALILGWDTLAGIFGPGEDPQLSTQPSTRETSPSESYAYDPDAKPTQSTKPRETTTPTTAPTAPPTTPSLPTPTETEPPKTEPAPTEPDLSWYVENPEQMSYQDFFSVERRSSGTLQPLVWTDPDGHECALVANNGFQIFRKSDSKYVYVIPGSESLADSCTVIGTNGKYAYLHNGAQLLQLDLLTGEVTELFTFSEILSYELPFREMCYIAAEIDDTISLCRLYLPTLTLDVLYDGIPARTPRAWLRISFPTSTQGTISWEGISPEMVDALYAEFSNPDSTYYPDFGDPYSDLSEFWEDPELIRQLGEGSHAAEPMIKLQDDKNLQALWKGTYNITDGTVTQDWGIVDTCWFGSGYPHDHWNPELTADIPPTVLNAEAIPVPGMVSPSEEMAAAIRQEGYDDQNKLYKAEGSYFSTKPVQIYQDGEYRTATHLPHVSARNRLINCKYYSYYASVDNTLIRLDLSGTASVIYTAKYGDLLETCYHGGNLYFLDGDTLVMLDTIACTSRELLTHPGSIYMYYDTGDQRLYIDTVLGMAINSYLFDPITGALEDTGYRL